MTDHPRGQHDARELLRKAGLRVTAVRVGIVEALGAAKSALDAQGVFESLRSASADRVTVYRTLNTLVESGLAHRVDPGDRIFRYGLTDHSHCNGEEHRHEHAHFVCDACGVVECIDDAEVIVRPRKSPLAERRFRVRQQDVTLHGTCERCGPGAGSEAKPAGRRAKSRKKG